MQLENSIRLSLVPTRPCLWVVLFVHDSVDGQNPALPIIRNMP